MANTKKLFMRTEGKRLGLAIPLVLLCSVFASLGQLFLKLGMDNLTSGAFPIISNYELILGCFFYAVGAVLMIFALAHGDLSIIYPFISLSFIWVSLLSVFFLGEAVLLIQWIGMILIISGVTFIGVGSENA